MAWHVVWLDRANGRPDGPEWYDVTDPLLSYGLTSRETRRRVNPDATLGRVVRVDRGECDVVTSDSRIRVLSDSTRSQGVVAPVTGDWVEVDNDEGLGLVISSVLPRHTKVSRRDPAERDLEQVLASNVDVVGVVHGIDRAMPPGRLERLLVLARDSGADAIVILSKNDLPHRHGLRAVAESVAGATPVIATSTTDGSGLDQLLTYIGFGRVMALVGASGVGKSSLVNALVGHELLETGEVRGDAKGRHVTTARELVLLPGRAGMILDTPGIRSIGLWEAERALDEVFGDLQELATACRFGDCSHESEPGCAIRSAVDNGDIDRLRVERFKAMSEELAGQRQREEQRARRNEKDGGRRSRRRRGK